MTLEDLWEGDRPPPLPPPPVPTSMNITRVVGLYIYFSYIQNGFCILDGHLTVYVDQGFSTSGSRPHLGSPSDFRGVARLSTNLLKNDGIFK